MTPLRSEYCMRPMTARTLRAPKIFTRHASSEVESHPDDRYTTLPYCEPAAAMASSSVSAYSFSSRVVYAPTGTGRNFASVISSPPPRRRAVSPTPRRRTTL